MNKKIKRPISISVLLVAVTLMTPQGSSLVYDQLFTNDTIADVASQVDLIVSDYFPDFIIRLICSEQHQNQYN